MKKKIKQKNQQSLKAITTMKKKLQPQTQKKCAECFMLNANCYCKQCNSIFCQKCFSSIHSFHSFKKHLKIPIGIYHGRSQVFLDGGKRQHSFKL